jgi:hypothetical protein
LGRGAGAGSADKRRVISGDPGRGADMVSGAAPLRGAPKWCQFCFPGAAAGVAPLNTGMAVGPLCLFAPLPALPDPRDAQIVTARARSESVQSSARIDRCFTGPHRQPVRSRARGGRDVGIASNST